MRSRSSDITFPGCLVRPGSAFGGTFALPTTAGRGQFSIEPVEVVPLVQEMCNLLELSVPKGVEINLVEDGSNPICDADITQLRQILMNLVLQRI